MVSCYALYSTLLWRHVLFDDHVVKVLTIDRRGSFLRAPLELKTVRCDRRPSDGRDIEDR
jgi:hypothetical protein